jgi:hypothetical protein
MSELKNVQYTAKAHTTGGRDGGTSRTSDEFRTAGVIVGAGFDEIRWPRYAWRAKCPRCDHPSRSGPRADRDANDDFEPEWRSGTGLHWERARSAPSDINEGLEFKADIEPNSNQIVGRRRTAPDLLQSPSFENAAWPKWRLSRLANCRMIPHPVETGERRPSRGTDWKPASEYLRSNAAVIMVSRAAAGSCSRQRRTSCRAPRPPRSAYALRN